MIIHLDYLSLCLFLFNLLSSYYYSGPFSSIKDSTQHLRGGQNSTAVVQDGHHWGRNLDGYVDGVDLCLNGPNDYGRCKLNRFPVCDSTSRICMYRRPRSDLFYDRLHHDPAYYVDYDKIQCRPAWRYDLGRKNNCNLCNPGVWCASLNRCTKHKKRFCPDDCHKAKFRRWCPSKAKCLRYRDVDGKGKEECPDWSRALLVVKSKTTIPTEAAPS